MIKPGHFKPIAKLRVKSVKQSVLKYQFHQIKQVFLKTDCVQTRSLPVGTIQDVLIKPTRAIYAPQ